MNEFIEKTNYREKKITSAEIIVTGTKDKPYFELKYKEVGKDDYSIGYSSYDLNNVFDWKEDCFEIVNELEEEQKVGCEWELEDAEMELYYTECGNAHIFAYGNPMENDYKFCPYCGKKIKVVE